MLLILKPDASGFLDPWLLLSVVCCVIYAIYLIATRPVSRTDAPTTSFFYTGVAGAVAATLVGPFSGPISKVEIGPGWACCASPA